MKVWTRFFLYSTLGLLLFSVYCLYALPFFLEAFLPEGAWETSLIMNTQEALVLAGTLLFCFASAGVLLSAFLVVPLVQLIARIQRIEAEKITPQKAKDGLVHRPREGKIAGLLFREVSACITHLEQRLDFAEKERQLTEDAKRAWLEGVTHDLKTPLSYITGYSSLLLTPGHSFEKAELDNHLATIYSKARQMNELIDDLNLSFMLDSGNPLPVCRDRVDPAELIQDVVDSFEADKRWDKYHIEVTLPDRAFFFWLDKKLILRALFNLMQNSLDHTPPGTTIRLSSGQRPDGNTFLAVEDDGGGMDDEALKRCLDKHYSGNGTRPGKGLGLFIVKSIADAHDAELTIKSSKSKGTSMRLVFPKEA